MLQILDFKELVKAVPLEHFHFSQRRAVFEIGWREFGKDLVFAGPHRARGRNASGRCRLVFHLCLDDPLMHRFSGEWIQGILKSLGMKDLAKEGLRGSPRYRRPTRQGRVC